MRAFLRVLYYVFVLLCLAVIVFNLPDVLVDSARAYKAYLWFGIGAAAYFVLRLVPLLRRNEKWLQTFSHELTHTIVGMMFFRKIDSFQVKAAGTGMVSHSGKRQFGSLFISLAPYCFPVFTYFFMLLRLLGSEETYYVFDILIGLTAAFHFMCFWNQTGNYQTDIQGQGYVRSYLFIAAWRLFNATVILLTVRFGIGGAVTRIFPQYWHTLVAWWNALTDWVAGLL